jgi:hypothetical protein
MALVQGAELVDLIVDGGESAKSLSRPGMARLLALVDSRAVGLVIVAKLDRLTRSVKQVGEADRLRQKQVEHARYEADLAQRRYLTAPKGAGVLLTLLQHSLATKRPTIPRRHRRSRAQRHRTTYERATWMQKPNFSGFRASIPVWEPERQSHRPSSSRCDKLTTMRSGNSRSTSTCCNPSPATQRQTGEQ